MISTWQKAHPVVEETRVVDGGATWDYFIDIGDKSETEKGKKADPKPTCAVAKAKAAKVKSKYALDTSTVTDKGDLAEVLDVNHDQIFVNPAQFSLKFTILEYAF